MDHKSLLRSGLGWHSRSKETIFSSQC